MGLQQGKPVDDGACAERLTLWRAWRIVRAHWGRLALLVLVGGSVAYMGTLLVPDTYEAGAVFMPITDSRQASSALAQLGQLVGGAGLSQSSRSGQIMALFKSRTLAERVVTRCELLPYFQTHYGRERVPTVVDAAYRLLKLLRITEDKRYSTVAFQVTLRDPELAYRVSTVYLEELRAFIGKNIFTQAKRNRIFVGQQVEINKMLFLEAGRELNSFYKRAQISSVDSKLDVPWVSESEEGEPPVNAEAMMAQERALAATLANERIVKDVPQQVYLQYLTLRRELLGKIATTLTQQYEMAKMEEAREELTFEVIDPPLLPSGPSGPRRLFIGVFAAMMVGLGYGCVIVYYGTLVRSRDEG